MNKLSKLKLLPRLIKASTYYPVDLLKTVYGSLLSIERKNQVVKKYELPTGLPCVDLLDLLPSFSMDVFPYSYLDGTSLPIDIAFLKGLAGKFEDCSFMEIGTWRGESIVNVASVARECVSLSLSDAELRELGCPEQYIQAQRSFSKDVENIRHIAHNSRTFDFSQFYRSFDLIFIDGDHTYEGIKNDTEQAFKCLKNEHSIIVWHDYGLESVNWTTLAGILDGTPAEKRSNLYSVSNTLCAIYVQGEFKTSELSYPSSADKVFQLSIAATRFN